MKENEEKVYLVTFSYVIDVLAANEDEAYEKAMRYWDDVMPRTDEMNIDIVKAEGE